MHHFPIFIWLLFAVLCCQLLPIRLAAAAGVVIYRPPGLKLPRFLVSTPPANRKILSLKKPVGASPGSIGIDLLPGNWDLCPPGTRAIGLSIKREPFQGGILDETSINGVKLFCSDDFHTEITSDVGAYGTWGPIRFCCEEKRGFLNAFAMAFDTPFSPTSTSSIDDAGVDEIDFTCKSTQKDYVKWMQKIRGVEGPIFGAQHRNVWTNWSESCNTGICGIRTFVDLKQTKGGFPPFSDLIGLRNVEFLCCAE